MSERETEELIFWRRLSNDMNERERAGAINKSITR